MIKLISADDNTKIYFNPKWIEAVYTGDDGVTRVRTRSGVSWTVQETTDEVVKQIQCFTKSP